MEYKLKRLRRKLIFRITLIFTAIWLAVSLTYCFIRLTSVINDKQKKLLEEFTEAKQQYMEGDDTNDIIKHLMFNYSPYQDDDSEPEPDRNWNGQIRLIGTQNLQTIDSTDSILIYCGIRLPSGGYYEYYGFVNHDSLMGSLTKEQIDEITRLLQAEPEKEGKYELICSEFYIRGAEIFPVTLEVVFEEKNSTWHSDDKLIKKFTATPYYSAEDELFHCDDIRRNVIPKDFFINGAYTTEYFSQLTNEQKKHTSDMVFTDPFECIFYSYDYLTINDYIFNLTNTQSDYSQQTYMICYATRFNLLDICGLELLIELFCIFQFYSIIGSMLGYMIWKFITAQVTQEQKRVELTRALAHDIKTPLFVISGYAYTMKEDIGEEKRDFYIDKILEQTDQINELVHRMLNLARLDSYKMVLNKSEIDLTALAGELINNYAKLPDNKKIVFMHDEKVQVCADEELLKTVLRNLMDNAIKYSLPDSEITVSVKGGSFTVSNKSEPLSKTDLKQIWQPFIRKDKSRHIKGNGLGLSIVRSIAELHGAKTEASYKDGIFTISLDFVK